MSSLGLDMTTTITLPTTLTEPWLMKPILCLAVGKLKTQHWLQAAEYYAKLLGRFVRLDRETVKDASGRLLPEQKKEVEGRALLAKIGSRDIVLGMTVQGEVFSSEDFAAALGKWLEDPIRRPCFVLGGAFGLSDEVLERCDRLISLGSMTLPHELARVVLFEQIYRAMTILKGTGYHH